MSNILLPLRAFIAGLFSQPTIRRAIVANPAKRPLQNYAEPKTIVLQSALSAVQNYQTASSNGRRAIVARPVKPQPRNDASVIELVPPLNRGLTRRQALALAHEMFNDEHKRQAALYRASNGRMPFYQYEWAGVANATYAAIGAEATALLKGKL